MDSFLLAFIPLFVAIDAISATSFFSALTHEFSKDEKRNLAFQAVLTALIIGVLFGFAGRTLFRFLGITTADFRIAGGLLLVIVSVKEIFSATNREVKSRVEDKFIGVVPLGIPLTAGPAMMTTLLILQDTHPYVTVLLALIANLAIALILFINSHAIEKRIGASTSKAMAKVIAIFLAAIGIMMIRKGLETFLRF